MLISEIASKIKKDVYARRKSWKKDEYLILEDKELCWSAGLPGFGSVTVNWSFGINDLKAKDWILVSRKDLIDEKLKTIDFDLIKSHLSNNVLDFTYIWFNGPIYNISLDSWGNSSGVHYRLTLLQDELILEVFSSASRKPPSRVIKANNSEYFDRLTQLQRHLKK